MGYLNRWRIKIHLPVAYKTQAPIFKSGRAWERTVGKSIPEQACIPQEHACKTLSKIPTNRIQADNTKAIYQDQVDFIPELQEWLNIRINTYNKSYKWTSETKITWSYQEMQKGPLTKPNRTSWSSAKECSTGGKIPQCNQGFLRQNHSQHHLRQRTLKAIPSSSWLRQAMHFPDSIQG